MISYVELTGRHCIEEETIREALSRMRPSDGLLLYANMTMDSSRFGMAHLALCGPVRTIKSAEEAPSRIDPYGSGGLPSQTEELIGEIDVEDVRRGLDSKD
jgi:hypothetical protein